MLLLFVPPGSCFTKFDEDLTKAFAIYCGISIFQVRLAYKYNNQVVTFKAAATQAIFCLHRRCNF